MRINLDDIEEYHYNEFKQVCQRIHPILQCWTLRNWFRPQNQFRFRLILQFQEFSPMPSNSALTEFPEFRTEIRPHPHPHASCFVRRLVHSICIQFRYGIPWIAWKRNRTEVRGIPRNSVGLRRILEFPVFRSIPGISSNVVRFRNCVRFYLKSIPEFRKLFGSGISWSCRN
jgi:hypothetical protein